MKPKQRHLTLSMSTIPSISSLQMCFVMYQCVLRCFESAAICCKALRFQVWLENTLSCMSLCITLVLHFAGIPICNQRIIYGSKQLEEGRMLTDYSVNDGSLLHLVLRLGVRYHIPYSLLIFPQANLIIK